MNRKLILKSPRFVPFGTNLAQLEAKSVIPEHSRPGVHNVCHWGNRLIYLAELSPSWLNNQSDRIGTNAINKPSVDQ